MVEGSYIADLIATLAMLDPILGGIDRCERPVRTLAHGSRVPGWDEAADLDEGPGGDPRPRDDAGARRSCATEIEAHMAQYPDRHSAAIPALHAAQRAHGWCSPEAIEQVACVMRRHARLPGVGGDLLRHARDAARRAPQRVRVHEHLLLAARRRRAATRRCSEARRRTTRTSTCARFECLGACDIAPMASVDGVYVGPLEPERRRRSCSSDVARRARRRCPSKQLAPPVADPHADPGRAAADAARTSRDERDTMLLRRTSTSPGSNTLAVYERRGGYEALRKALRCRREDVLAELEASGLRGRGGAGFSMGKKVSFLPKGSMDKYLVCNADESEPGTFKDRELMQKNPHMLIEGIVIASYAAGANRSFIYIRGEYVLQADILDAALAEAREAGLPRRATSSAPATRCRWSCTAARAPTSAARRPALLDSLEGKRGNPRLKPPFPANQGLYQGPTLINNVETLATVPHDHRDGRRGVRQARHARPRPGTKLVSVSGHVAAPGQLRDRARHPLARDHLRPRRRPAATGARSSSGSPAARPRRC